MRFKLYRVPGASDLSSFRVEDGEGLVAIFRVENNMFLSVDMGQAGYGDLTFFR